MRESAATLHAIRRRYPNALSTAETVDRFLDLVQRRLQLKPADIMLADSICSDDLNTIEYPARAYEMLGPFKMGGLDGFPFAGLTGMSAFAHHVPEHGAVFLFHGPHIGVSGDGDTGVIVRPGQHSPSACCGAIGAAVAKLSSGAIIAGKIDELDYQQGVLEHLLLKQRERVLASRCAVAEATEVMYGAIEQRIDTLIARTDFPCRHVVVMGGVLINSDHDIGSFCSFRRLVCIDVPARRSEDWLQEFLGDAGHGSTDHPHARAMP